MKPSYFSQHNKHSTNNVFCNLEKGIYWAEVSQETALNYTFLNNYVLLLYLETEKHIYKQSYPCFTKKCCLPQT